MPGLLEIFAPQATQSPLYQAFDQNRYALSNMLLGGVGKQGADRLAGMSQGLLAQNAINQQLGVQRQKEAKAQQEVNKTAEFLKTRSPELSQIVEMGGLSPSDAYGYYFKAQQAQKPDVFAQRATAAQQYGLQSGTPEFQNFVLTGDMPNGSANGPKYGMNPVYLQNADGTVGIGQLTSDGRLNPSAMPDGYEVLSPYEKSKQTTQGREEAKAQVEAEQALYGARQTAEMVNTQVDDLLNDSALSSVTGPIQGRTPNFFGSSHRAQSKIDQLQGGAFLQARQMLKGGGQITDFEGKKAEAAFSRMVQSQNDADFRQALEDFRDAVNEGVRKLEAQAFGGQYSPGQPAAGKRLKFNPETGELR